ncbi:MAG: hypothetical protein KY468_12355 [Armatimonadetes bacterium]|nr:hypothetical protein [Armatimonadota bacterium]
MPKLELNFSWENISVASQTGYEPAATSWLDFGTERLMENAARSLGAPMSKAREFVQFMPIWDDPALRSILQPELDQVEAFARDAWLSFQAEHRHASTELIVRDHDQRLPGISGYFEQLLLPLRPAPVALSPLVLEEQARRFDWYRSPLGIGIPVGLGLGVAAATWVLLSQHSTPDKQPSTERATGSSASMPRDSRQAPGPKVSENPPVAVNPSATARLSPAPDLGSKMGAPANTQRKPVPPASTPPANKTLPPLPRNAPRALPPVAMTPPPSAEMILPPPGFRAPRQPSQPSGSVRRDAPPAPPQKRSMMAVAPTREAEVSERPTAPTAFRPLPSTPIKPRTETRRSTEPKPLPRKEAPKVRTAPAPTPPALKSTRPDAEERLQKNSMVAAAPRSAPKYWSPSAFSNPYRVSPPSTDPADRSTLTQPDRAKPKPKRIPASAYPRAREMDRIARAPRPSASPEMIEGKNVSLNRILDRLTTQMNCSYILQPGIKTDMTVRLDLKGEPDEALAQILRMAGLSFKVNGRVIYIGQEEWLEQVFPTVQASLVITESGAEKMDDTVDVATKVSDGKLEIKRVGRYSVLTGSPEHLRLLLTSQILPADMSVQALYESQGPTDGLLKQIPTSILAGNAMEGFEDRSVRIQGTPSHVAAALNVLVAFDRAQSGDRSQLAMLRDTARVRGEGVTSEAVTHRQ